MIIDKFLSDSSFDTLRKHCDQLDYEGELNPVDGIFYPGVSLDIPHDIRSEIVSKLGHDITPRSMFLRLSADGTRPPHGAHTDVTMGKYGLFIYLNRIEHCLGGTSFVIHTASGLVENPINEQQEAIWKMDTNNPDAWQILEMVPMSPNRALVFDTSRMHMALPVAGFGNNAEDGRLLLVCFFD